MTYQEIISLVLKLAPTALSLLAFIVGLVSLAFNKKASYNDIKAYTNEMLPVLIQQVEKSGLTGSTAKKEVVLSTALTAVNKKFKLSDKDLVNITAHISESTEAILSCPQKK